MNVANVISTQDTNIDNLRNDGVYVIRLYNFYGTAPKLFEDAMRPFIESGSKKLILDLRGNPGGYLEGAVELASWFLPKGDVVVKELSSRQSSEDRIYVSKGYHTFGKDFKMMILVDRGSASAAEILAGALDEYGVAKLVGEKTFGKGSVQELIKLTPDTSLKLTIARWYTPNGVNLSNGGLTPEYVVTPTEADLAKSKDPVFDKAIQLLLK
jgi:carboxyl-terminal processing protease